MPSRAELVLRADAVGFDPATIHNDSKLEQHILYLEKNASTLTGTLATGTLTQSGAATALDEIKIGDVTYTFVTALTGVKATAELTSDTTAPDDGDTVSVAGTVYTFKTALTNTAQNEVLIGASAAAALDNLKTTINGTGQGSTCSVDTVAHPRVTATTNTDTVQTVEAKEFGTEANSWLVSETSAHLAFGATTMGAGTGTEVDGVANVPNEIVLTGVAATELDSLKLAINNSATEGTEYSFGTKAHPQVTATTNGASTQVVAARDMSVGEDISTTDPVDDGTVFSWGATTLASAVAAQNAVDATAKAQVSGDKNQNV